MGQLLGSEGQEFTRGRMEWSNGYPGIRRDKQRIFIPSKSRRSYGRSLHVLPRFPSLKDAGPKYF
jgi:hypothetical protein